MSRDGPRKRPRLASALREMAEGDLSEWAEPMRERLAAEMKARGGIAVVDGFLPRAVAEELREAVYSLGPGKWAISKDDGEEDDIRHSFLSCSENISDINRILWSLMPEKLPSFSAARYMNGHGIARHNDELTISDGCGGNLVRDTAVVLYLVDDDWNTHDGGLFLDYGVEKDSNISATEKAAQKAPEQTIVPAFNRLVAFDVPRYHEVTAVTVEDDVLRPRLSVFGWFLVPEEEEGNPKNDTATK